MEECPFNEETTQITSLNLDKLSIKSSDYDNKDQDVKLPTIETRVDKPKKKKNSKKRCNHPECRKKLSLVDTTMGGCKCEKYFCSLHRNPESHNCTFDWHNTKKNELAEVLNSNKCVACKLTSI